MVPWNNWETGYTTTTFPEYFRSVRALRRGMMLQIRKYPFDLFQLEARRPFTKLLTFVPCSGVLPMKRITLRKHLKKAHRSWHTVTHARISQYIVFFLYVHSHALFAMLDAGDCGELYSRMIS